MKRTWKKMFAGILVTTAILSAGAFSAFASCHGYAYHDPDSCPRPVSYDCTYVDADNDGVCDYHIGNSCQETGYACGGHHSRHARYCR